MRPVRPVTLTRQIWARFKTGVFESRAEHFFPANEIDQLVTVGAIRARLEGDKGGSILDDEESDLVRWIKAHATRVFAIVVQVDLPSPDTLDAMKHFKKFGFDDARLPIHNPTRTDSEWDNPRGSTRTFGT